MIRYRYNEQMIQPAPFVRVDVVNPLDGVLCPEVSAQIDTGADRTLIPKYIAELLNLSNVGSIELGGFDGTTVQSPLYSIQLLIHGQIPVDVVVGVWSLQRWVLLGRDVLNQCRIVLDGPARALEIE